MDTAQALDVKKEAEKLPASSPRMQQYFRSITEEVKRAYSAAGMARARGFDPEGTVNIPQARNMAERVEGLMSEVAPQLVGSSLIPRIGELEKEYGLLDWRVALKIAEETAAGKFCTFKDRHEALEVGIRTGFAYHTLGIVAAPLEGFIGLRIKKCRNGREYLAPCFAGPVRGAGGTAEAFCLVLTDYLRMKFGYSPYDPDEDEVNRFYTEIRDYHERVSNLQYYPSEEEVRFLARHIPVEVDGDPTAEIEVSNYKDLPRVETNRIRGGVCLVLAEGMSQKAPKVWKRLSKWGREMGLEWGFLEEFLALQKRIKAGERGEESPKEKKKLSANFTYIKDIVAGRPVLTHPLRAGGFRLRYGRSRITGFSAGAIHPATQYVLDNYIGTGTQIKVERPGKACSLTVCDALEGPIVRLTDGSVVQLRTAPQAKARAKDVEKVLFIGDILFNYGDFAENSHMLIPAGYCPEWWLGEVAKAIGCPRDRAADSLPEKAGITPEEARAVSEWWSEGRPPLVVCERISRSLGVPLHPSHIGYWGLLSPEEARKLVDWLLSSEVKEGGKWVLRMLAEGKTLLENIGIEHDVSAGEFVVISPENAAAVSLALGLDARSRDEVRGAFTAALEQGGQDTLGILNSLSSVRIRDKAGTFIGCRMGRPEKSKMRKLTGSPHTLFPVGKEGERLRSFNCAVEKGSVKADFALFECPLCRKLSVYGVCHRCSTRTEPRYYCRSCDAILPIPECGGHGKVPRFRNREIPIREYFNQALSLLNEPAYPDLVKGVRGTSNKNHIPEHLFKGLLRAKHEIHVNKDGTTRYDITELPVTHFKPREIHAPVERLRELGYAHDIKGEPLERDDQILEIFPQDVILPANLESLEEAADVVLFRIAAFVDELLVKLYGIEPYYNLSAPSDLIGHLVIGLAPHISAGTIGRVIGFSNIQGCFAHPLWHAALRRDCDGDECSVILLMDALLNFSRQYLPDKRGSRTMDSPLVLTLLLNPSEVDDMSHGLDVVWEYAPEFYEAALNFTPPKEFPVEQLGRRLGTPGQYEGMGFTHPVSDMNSGVLCSAYKTIPTMMEKLQGQMAIAEKLRAVDEVDVAKLVIEKHFIKDIKGNLRKFSQQQFRCSKCNEKYPRPPLAGKCTRFGCGGKILFTIAEGSVVKYLEPSISLAEKYDLPPYLKETLELVKLRVESMFGREKETQTGLGKWFG